MTKTSLKYVLLISRKWNHFNPNLFIALNDTNQRQTDLKKKVKTYLHFRAKGCDRVLPKVDGKENQKKSIICDTQRVMNWSRLIIVFFAK